MTINGEWDLRAGYESFNDDSISDLMALFDRDATYHLTDEGQTVRGLDCIKSYLASRDIYIDPYQIADVRIKSASHLVERERGAVACFRVGYITIGRYVRTLPGLGGRAEAHGDHVRVPTSEIVWFNAAGKIIRVNHAMTIAALQ